MIQCTCGDGSWMDILELVLEFISMIGMLFALFQTSKAIRSDSDSARLDRRIDIYVMLSELKTLYLYNDKTMDSKVPWEKLTSNCLCRQYQNMDEFISALSKYKVELRVLWGIDATTPDENELVAAKWAHQLLENYIWLLRQGKETLMDPTKCERQDINQHIEGLLKAADKLFGINNLIEELEKDIKITK